MAQDKYNALSVNQEGTKPTYTVRVFDYAPGSVTTAMLAIQNPAANNKLFRITQIRINGDSTANALQDIYAFIRNTLSTGGTSTTPNVDINDINDPAASATPVLYSANATLGGSTTNIRGGHIVFVAATSPTIPNADVVWQWGDRAAKCPVIRPGYQVELSLNSTAAAAGLSLYLSIEWTEESLQ